nr:DUF1493 family protein [Rosenbergiella epipactidis]
MLTINMLIESAKVGRWLYNCTCLSAIFRSKLSWCA